MISQAEGSWTDTQDARVGDYSRDYGWPFELTVDVKSALYEAAYDVFGMFELEESQSERAAASERFQELLLAVDSRGVDGWDAFVAGDPAPTLTSGSAETATQYAERLFTTVALENGWSEAEKTYALLGIDAGEDAGFGTASVDDSEFWAPVRDNLRSYPYLWPQGWQELVESIESLYNLKRYEEDKFENALKGAGEDLLEGGMDLGKVAVGMIGIFLLGKFL